MGSYVEQNVKIREGTLTLLLNLTDEAIQIEMAQVRGVSRS